MLHWLISVAPQLGGFDDFLRLLLALLKWIK